MLTYLETADYSIREEMVSFRLQPFLLQKYESKRTFRILSQLKNTTITCNPKKWCIKVLKNLVSAFISRKRWEVEAWKSELCFSGSESSHIGREVRDWLQVVRRRHLEPDQVGRRLRLWGGLVPRHPDRRQQGGCPGIRC